MVNGDDVRDPKVIFEKKLGVEKLTGGLTLLTPEDCGYDFIIYIYIFYAFRLVLGDDGKYVYNTRLAWLMGTMYETPKVIFQKMLRVEKLPEGFNPPNPQRLNHWTMYVFHCRHTRGDIMKKWMLDCRPPRNTRARNAAKRTSAAEEISGCL